MILFSFFVPLFLVIQVSFLAMLVKKSFRNNFVKFLRGKCLNVYNEATLSLLTWGIKLTQNFGF